MINDTIFNKCCNLMIERLIETMVWKVLLIILIILILLLLYLIQPLVSLFFSNNLAKTITNFVSPLFSFTLISVKTSFEIVGFSFGTSIVSSLGLSSVTISSRFKILHLSIILQSYSKSILFKSITNLDLNSDKVTSLIALSLDASTSFF